MQPPHDLDALAFDFFRTFSRMEYALKASGYNNKNGPAKADWTAFAKAIEQFVAAPPTPALQEAIAFLFKEPPKMQFLVLGKLEWRDVAPATNSQSDALFQYIRRIRNNLFHGGKFNGRWFEPQRSEQLLQSAHSILLSAAEVDQGVREAFHGSVT
jgi:hypothetical protein